MHKLLLSQFSLVAEAGVGSPPILVANALRQVLGCRFGRGRAMQHVIPTGEGQRGWIRPQCACHNQSDSCAGNENREYPSGFHDTSLPDSKFSSVPEGWT